ncbi:accessory factor UbiK family protein [Acinetobacter qingfengensis]|uniref:Membrane fusogenic activity n=1 Tax=Acinetobacter qingfengensis TaxID=1262585 RepID=A0A1E7RDI5_9GAMM|nr:accessory factor UbiK family protein [Acinetobacter qingfengensis]KAA8732182.1 accessory factor UbiK family protein [Acinetobacter qingfengensis]OEY97287.1 membrane fusogenic activity [Acinetobacter qingfengensis]
MLDSFVAALKEQIATPKADLEKNIRTLLNEMVIKMDLVSQQELERQKQALTRANLRLDALKQQLSELETKLKSD